MRCRRRHLTSRNEFSPEGLDLVRGASALRRVRQANHICIVLKEDAPRSCPASQFDLQPTAPCKFIELCCHKPFDLGRLSENGGRCREFTTDDRKVTHQSRATLSSSRCP